MIRLIYDRSKIYHQTQFSVQKHQFDKGKIVDHHEANKINKILRRDIIEIEKKVIDYIDFHSSKGIEYLKEKIKGINDSESFESFVTSFIEKYGRNFSKGTVTIYKQLSKKLQKFRPRLKIGDIDYNFMSAFEASLRTDEKANNTVVKNMQTFISLMNKAHKLDLIEKGSWGKYKKPKYIQTVPTWLTEDEIKRFAALVYALGEGEKKQAGFYYLLCCYTGYRLGTAKQFDYSKSVTNGKIFIRSTKNHNIVSIPIHTRLGEVLEYCKDHPFTLSEQKTREHVKTICWDAGIKKDLIFHSSRHSFGMLLMANGFTIDEVAELIGDSELVAKVYARVHNDLLDKKIMEKLG